MVPKKINFKAIEKNSSGIFLDRAESFYKAMRTEYELENWHAAGLSAVHCVISANDALLVKTNGIYCTAKDHLLAVEALTQNFTKAGVKEASNHLRKVIALKNVIEYEAKVFTQKQAETVVFHAEKFYKWILEQLKNQ